MRQVLTCDSTITETILKVELVGVLTEHILHSARTHNCDNDVAVISWSKLNGATCFSNERRNFSAPGKYFGKGDSQHFATKWTEQGA